MDGVPWHSAVEITQDFTHLQFVREHPGWAGAALGRRLTKFETKGHPPGGFVAEHVGKRQAAPGHLRSPVHRHERVLFVDEEAPDGKKAFPLCFVFASSQPRPGKPQS